MFSVLQGRKCKETFMRKKKMLPAKQTSKVNKRGSGASSQWKGHYAIYWQSSYLQSQGYPSEYFPFFEYCAAKCRSHSFGILQTNE